MSARLTTTSSKTHPTNTHPTIGMPSMLASERLNAELKGRRAQAAAIASAAGQIVAPIVAGLRWLTRAWAHQGEISRAYDQLKRFDDRLLADIGLDRNNLLVSLRQRQALTASAAPASIDATAHPTTGHRAQVQPAANLDHPPSAKSSRAA